MLTENGMICNPEPRNDGHIAEDVLFRALRAAIGEHMDDPAIMDLVYYLMNFFGFNGSVVDNVLTPVDRDVFYMLEEAGIVGTEQEEVLIRRGKLWRIHYWVMRKDNIKRLASTDRTSDDEGDQYSIYEHLSDDMWHRDNSNA